MLLVMRCFYSPSQNCLVAAGNSSANTSVASWYTFTGLASAAAVVDGATVTVGYNLVPTVFTH